jgi:REP element-mobilizing transposase RayT
MRHYNEPGHAHELTFSFYRGRSHGNDTVLCELFLEELDHSRQSDDFLLWAYVIMPSHVHMLIRLNTLKEILSEPGWFNPMKNGNGLRLMQE